MLVRGKNKQGVGTDMGCVDQFGEYTHGKKLRRYESVYCSVSLF